MLQLSLILITLQQNPAPIGVFRSIHAFQCDLGGGGGHNYDDGGGNLNEERVITSPPYKYDDARDLIFDSIDYRTLRARSVTKNNPVTVTVIPGDRLVSFLEVTRDGVPIITSILRTPLPLDHRVNNTYHVVRSYQLLVSETGDSSWQLGGVCRARQ